MREVVHDWCCSRPAAPRAIERRGRNRRNAAACLRASWYPVNDRVTALPNSPRRRKWGRRLCPSLSCRTESTISASPLPPALPWTAQWHGRSSLVARRAKSAVLLSVYTISLELICSPSSSSFRQVGLICCSTDIV